MSYKCTINKIQLEWNNDKMKQTQYRENNSGCAKIKKYAKIYKVDDNWT